MAQRIVRAKRKIVEAGIPYRVPSREELTGRLQEVLVVLYLLFNEGYLASGGPAPDRRDLTHRRRMAGRPAGALLPEEPEVLGLLALMRLHLARSGSRFDAGGRLVLLPDQDRSRWDRRAITAAGRPDRGGGGDGPAGALPDPGRHRGAAQRGRHLGGDRLGADRRPLLAAAGPPAVTGRPPQPGDRAPPPGRPAAALAEVDAVAPELDSYHLLHATRAELLRDLGRIDEARAEDATALRLTNNPAERELLLQRLLD